MVVTKRLQTLLILQFHMLLLPVWSFNSLLSEGASLVVTCIGWRRGHKETCLICSGTLMKTGRKKCHYPVTKNGRLDCGLVRNAKARAAQQGKLSSIMSGGWKRYASKCHVKRTVYTFLALLIAASDKSEPITLKPRYILPRTQV